jgi:uncharacterized membrane protein YecN with MAPEG domain
MLLPIALTTTGAAALLNVWLGVRVAQVRMSEKVLTGDAGNARVIARMRAHANYTEYTPMVLILVALVEFAAGSPLWLWAVAALYLVSRVLHPFGMDGWRLGREIGAGVTLLTLLGLGIYAVYLASQYANPLR